MRTFTRPAAVASAALLLVGLSGCSESVFDLEVGDCMNSPDVADEELSSVSTVPCDEPHDAEAYAAMMFEDGDFPGLQGVVSASEAYCLDEFETFIGLPYDASELGVTSIYPTQDSWDRLDDREVLCLVIDEQGDVTGSLEGAQR
ncbi:septum formation family protein [Actinotalea sp. BY-33]|uniref:Septum formation family protein n=1 Tax=Actinotalea soli TaxID=2819234 RepID=A0A939LS61_9CELL|nr:septum formation family protein [Actinotalea soli]MBO1753103.1 septum formation family protein [Actinotalea soli]